ncbi:group 1 truncated hemoglobin [Colwelliaceae bacterium 6471]
MKNKSLIIITLSYVLTFTGCSSTSNVYQEVGGTEKITEIVDYFIEEITFSPEIYAYFEESDVDRFREKMIEHVCHLIAGPCEYTGDTMVDVHTGMNVNEAHFNLTVDLFINAMDRAGIAHSVQNKILNAMAKTRSEIIYR